MATPKQRDTGIFLRASAAYAAWLDKVSRDTSIPKARLMRIAFVDMAKKMKIKPPPER